MEIKGNIISLLLKTGSLLNGHFLLSSGMHSPRYLQCATVLQHPIQASFLGKELTNKFAKKKIDVVVGLALGGIIIAHEIARVLGVRAIWTERSTSGNGKMELRRGFNINNGEMVLVAEDVITTGGSVNEVIELIKKLGGKIVGVGCLIDRRGSNTNQNIIFAPRMESLANLDIETYTPNDCPLCKKGVPIVKPGSKQ